jgi:hypothetical protein
MATKRNFWSTLQRSRRLICGCLGLIAVIGVPTETTWAAAEPIQVQVRPITDTFPSITSTAVRLDVVFNGHVKRSDGNQDVRGARIRVDMTRDSDGLNRAMTIGGSALGLVIGEAERQRLELRQFGMYAFGDDEYVNMVGGLNVCMRTNEKDIDLRGFQDQLQPISLLGSYGFEDNSSFAGRPLGIESVNGVRARRYEVIDPQSRSRLSRAFIWVALKGDYIVKLDGETEVTHGDDYNLVDDFHGSYRLTYSIVGVNSTARVRLPKACERALGG